MLLHTHTHTHTTLSFRKYLSSKSDITVRGNVAYGDVNQEPGEEAAVYEDIDKMVRFVEGKYELTERPVAPVSQPADPVYDTAGDVTKSSY